MSERLEMKCKRCGANEDRIHGFCSIECRDQFYLEEDIAELTTRIAELEAEQARWVMVSERLPNISGWYLACLIGWAGSYYTTELYFDTETGLPWRSSVRDEVYCWLDGVPEMPKPPEVQE